MTATETERAPTTFSVEVLGCKVNQHEAQQIRCALEAAGLRAAADGTVPDLAVVHTCAVTAEALRQSRQAARRRGGAATRLILSGCGASPQLGAAAEVAAAAVVPAGPNWVERLVAAAESLGARGAASAHAAGFGTILDRFAGHTRAFVKAQDGCDNGCAYCIVPRLRGPPRDRPAGEILAEARSLAAAGHAELVLSGVCVGRYGDGGGRETLADLIAQLDRVEGLERLRLSSLHPAELTDELLAAWRASPKMAPHAHLPLQSGSDAVLARMGRGYTAAQFLEAVERLRRALDRPAIATDVIVGFPGETEDDFEQTLAVARRAGFSRIHGFRFSPRPGTPAAALRPTVAAPVARARARRLQEEAARLSTAFHAASVGRIVRVLAETRVAARGEWKGYDERYISVRFPGGPEWAGRLAPVRLTAADAAGARGELVAEDRR